MSNSNLSVVMLGTGSPQPDLERSGPAQVLFINDHPILIDCGEGTTSQLMKANIPPQDVNYLFMTHLHSDHFFGYGQFLLGGWGRGRRELTVIGPKGMKKFHDTLVNMFHDDIAYRTSLGRPGNGVLDVNIIEINELGIVPCDLPVNVTTEKMIHNVPTFGYRFEVGDEVVVFGGDTAPTPNIVKLARNADILVQDSCLASTGIYRNTQDPELLEIWDNLQKEHCTPQQAGEIAQEAGVKKLILTHFLPNIKEDEVYQEATNVFDGETIVGKDLLKVSVEKRTAKL